MQNSARMIPISAITIASTVRNPQRCSSRISSTSSPVISTPQIRGMWNSRFSAIADPITSARSQAAIAISARIHSVTPAHLPVDSRQSCAKSRSVATPSFRLRLCSRMAIRFDAMITNSSVYPNCEPPAISVAQFPGSM